MAELCLLSTAFSPQCVLSKLKFKVDSFYSFEVMAWTKIQNEHLQRAVTSPSPQNSGRFMVLVHCVSP